jgi:hypothetical protein
MYAGLAIACIGNMPGTRRNRVVYCHGQPRRKAGQMRDKKHRIGDQITIPPPLSLTAHGARLAGEAIQLAALCRG